MTKFILPLGLLVLNAACATHMYLPTNRFMSPEAQGKTWATAMAAGAYSAVMMDPIQNIDVNPPVVYPPQLQKHSVPKIVLPSFDMGFGERFDLGLRFSLNETPWILRAKYQVIGDPRRAAKAGNFSFALGAGMGNLNSGYTSWNWFNVSNSTSGVMKRETEELYAGLGLRAIDAVLFYADVTYSHHATGGSITKTSSQSTSIAVFSGEGHETAFHAGTHIYFRPGWPTGFFALEAAQTTVSWSHAEPFTYAAVGAALGLAL
ncbi:MAG TPA: hypothetical protein VFV50_06030 [Bdellovibrionales bacterium]|nr:hypothetical protein [Bdellovibrionales bacterium]